MLGQHGVLVSQQEPREQGQQNGLLMHLQCQAWAFECRTLSALTAACRQWGIEWLGEPDCLISPGTTVPLSLNARVSGVQAAPVHELSHADWMQWKHGLLPERCTLRTFLQVPSSFRLVMTPQVVRTVSDCHETSVAKRWVQEQWRCQGRETAVSVLCLHGAAGPHLEGEEVEGEGAVGQRVQQALPGGPPHLVHHAGAGGCQRAQHAQPDLGLHSPGALRAWLRVFWGSKRQRLMVLWADS